MLQMGRVCKKDGRSNDMYVRPMPDLNAELVHHNKQTASSNAGQEGGREKERKTDRQATEQMNASDVGCMYRTGGKGYLRALV